MTPSLPPEILDLIVDHLHDERTTLDACCRASKSWIPRARRHLFFSIEFSSKSLIGLWIKDFPDPSTSPAHYTRVLSFLGSAPLASAHTLAHPRVRDFRHIIDLQLCGIWGIREISLIPLHGLFPTLKSLSVSLSRISPSEIATLICSFPLLKDLELCHLLTNNTIATHKWSAPSTFPELTGTLRLSESIPLIPVAFRLMLDLPNSCFCFSRIVLMCHVNHADLAADLVSKCSNTLESLSIGYFSPSTFTSASVVSISNHCPCIQMRQRTHPLLTSPKPQNSMTWSLTISEPQTSSGSLRPS